MKKFKKVLSFVAACTMAMAMVLPFAAMADITFNVTPPADWDGVCLWPFETTDADGKALDSTFNPEIMPAAWPGWPMEEAGGVYTYTLKAAATDCCLASSTGAPQSVDIKGLVSGTYSFTDGVLGEDGKYTFTQTDGAGTKTETTTEETTTEGTTTDSTPKTADAAPIAAIAIVGLVSVAVVVATRKKAIA